MLEYLNMEILIVIKIYITSILDLGFKFVPNLFNNEHDLKISKSLNTLYENSHISMKLFKSLKARINSKLGTPRLLPKLH